MPICFYYIFCRTQSWKVNLESVSQNYVGTAYPAKFDAKAQLLTFKYIENNNSHKILVWILNWKENKTTGAICFEVKLLT